MQTKTPLMQHQSAAFEKLSRLRVGALFMEMGTGKSRVAIELALQKLKNNKCNKVIWACPVSVKSTIVSEIRKHTDCESIYMFDGKTRKGNIPRAFFYILGIESISSSVRVIEAFESIVNGSMLIVDESHLIKGAFANRTNRFIYIGSSASYRFILTGTPLSNGIEDLYCQIHFLSPKILGYNSFRQFARFHLEYDERNWRRIAKRKFSSYISTRMAPYVYQVKKEECLDLPPKTYSTSSFGMTKEQRGFYEAFYYELLLSKESFEFGDATIYRLLSGLQRITTGICPSEDGDINIFETSTDNPRIKCLQGIISNIDTRRKVIIWCKYLSEIEDIQSLNLDASLFNGRLSQRERELSLLRFRESKRFFISTLACGGLGLTLNEADYVIFYNQSFKLSERIQSEDRAHRIGQDKSVHYITIYCAASVDEMIMNNIGRKERVVNQFRKEIETIKQFKSKKDAEKAIRELAQKY